MGNYNINKNCTDSVWQFDSISVLTVFSDLWLWNVFKFIFSSVQFSRSVMSNSLRPHESQHARPPCPSPTPWVHSDSRPLSQWCHPAISSSVIPFSSCPQTLPASESFPMSQLLAWGGQSTGVSVYLNFMHWSIFLLFSFREGNIFLEMVLF